MNETDHNRPIFAFGICNIGCDQSHATFQTIVPDGAVQSVASTQPENQPEEPTAGEESVELCHLIHPSVSDESEQWQIHHEIANLVRRHSMMDICQYLTALANEHKILLPLSPDIALRELHRMGMPEESTPGFSYKNFCKYYRK